MRKASIRIVLYCSASALAVLALAQGMKKPGLWETTSVMTWQKSPFPPNMPMAPGGNSPFGGGKHVSQVCITQAMIDRYGAPAPQPRRGCQVTNVVKSSDSMTGDWVCTGMMNGKGSIVSHWTGDGHSTAKVHFVGSMQMGPNPVPVEWTTESTSDYKSSDCGSVQPAPMPDK